MPSQFPSDDPRTFRLLIDDYANHASAMETIARMGRSAINPLDRYLAEGPQVNPQGRLFAVSMLARFPFEKKGDSLRRVLHDTRLCNLPASQRDAEYQVKSAVLAQLAQHDYPQKRADIAFGVESERLSVAVQAAGRLKMAALGPAFVRMLEDDVLERVAGKALVQLGDAGALAILVALPGLFDKAQDNVRSRLALTRALLALARLGTALPTWVKQTATRSHPAVSAAAALLAIAPMDPFLTESLVHGALSDQAELARRCRARLWDEMPCLDGLVKDILERGTEPDIYGNPHALGREARLWLVRAAWRGNPHAQ